MELFQSLKAGSVKAQGFVRSVLKPNYKGMLNVMSLEKAWITKYNASNTEEKALLSRAEEKWNEKPIDANFWEV